MQTMIIIIMLFHLRQAIHTLRINILQTFEYLKKNKAEPKYQRGGKPCKSFIRRIGSWFNIRKDFPYIFSFRYY